MKKTWVIVVSFIVRGNTVNITELKEVDDSIESVGRSVGFDLYKKDVKTTAEKEIRYLTRTLVFQREQDVSPAESNRVKNSLIDQLDAISRSVSKPVTLNAYLTKDEHEAQNGVRGLLKI